MEQEYEPEFSPELLEEQRSLDKEKELIGNKFIE
jgi:hypothetical protein